jgi:hypothetical protein
MEYKVQSGEGEDKACDLCEGQFLLQEEIGTEDHYERGAVDEDYGPCSIRISHPPINADELQTEEETHYEPVEKAYIFMKQGLFDGDAIHDAKSRGNHRPEKGVENGRKSQVGNFNCRVVQPPEHGQNNQYRETFRVEMVFNHPGLLLKHKRNIEYI